MFSQLDTLFIGIGTSGKRALKVLKEEELPGNYLLVSDKKTDVENDISFLEFKGEAQTITYSSDLTIIFTSLTGNTGPYVAPHLCSNLKSKGSYVISVAYPPLPFYKNKYFKAANTLRRLKRTSNIVFLVDNLFYKEKYGNIPLNEFYYNVNLDLAKAIRYILSDESSLDDIKEFRGGIGLIISTKEDKITSSIAKILTKAYSLAITIESSISIVSGKRHPSLDELERIYRGLSIFEGGPPISIRTTELSAETDLTLVAIGKTILEEYDPVAKILGDRVLDDEPEVKLNIELPKLIRID